MRKMRAGSAAVVELIRVVVVISFTGVGFRMAKSVVPDPASGNVILGALLGSFVGYVIGGVLGRSAARSMGVVEDRMRDVNGADAVAGTIGAIGGLLAAGLLFWPLLFLPVRWIGFGVLAFGVIIGGYLGFRFALAKREDMLQLFGLSWRTRASDIKVLDSSAILDPRLLECVRAGFIRGPLIVPGFVLEEVQSIADAGDPVRRARGRRGLETLTALQREQLGEIHVVTDRTFPEFEEVDAKVIALARERGGAVVTNDTALGRIAELQGIQVMSLNALGDAMRAPVLPGEELDVLVQKSGREPGQGVGYLDDGTMVVVEDGRGEIGSTVHVSVTSVLQTSGGRMIFSRPIAGRSHDAAS